MYEIWNGFCVSLQTLPKCVYQSFFDSSTFVDLHFLLSIKTISAVHLGMGMPE